MCSVCTVAAVLVLVGALNWGLVGAFNFNLVNAILGAWPMAERIIYIVVGLAALLMIVSMMGKCKKCEGACGGACKGGSCSGSGEGSAQ